MFVRRLQVDVVNALGYAAPCPIKGMDSFAMRNFTNDAIFDDTLPIADGVMEAGLRVPLDALQAKMQIWLQRKGYLQHGDTLRITEK